MFSWAESAELPKERSSCYSHFLCAVCQLVQASEFEPSFYGIAELRLLPSEALTSDHSSLLSNSHRFVGGGDILSKWWGRWDLIVIHGGAISRTPHFESFLFPRLKQASIQSVVGSVGYEPTICPAQFLQEKGILRQRIQAGPSGDELDRWHRCFVVNLR